MCVNVYAELIASMTIHLMENGEHGDTRVKDELSRMVDITPNPLMTHQGFMETIVRTLMTEGNQVTLPVFASGLLMQLDPVPPSRVTFVPEGRGYRVNVGGASFAPDEVIHFALNPDPEYPWRGMGYEVALFAGVLYLPVRARLLRHQRQRERPAVDHPGGKHEDRADQAADAFGFGHRQEP